jgi:hypothetical protein
MAAAHVTATIVDNQTNRTTQRVRFWVEPAGGDREIVHTDMSQLAARDVVLRFKDEGTNTGHVVFGSDDLMLPFAAWAPLPELEYTAEPNGIRRIRVQTPVDATNAYFFRIEKP